MRNVKALKVSELADGTWIVSCPSPYYSKQLALKGLPGAPWWHQRHATYDEAVGAAHMIGRYKLGLGDLLFTYVDGLRDE